MEVDSGGAIHNTFEEDELSKDVRAVLVSTLYLRARWRSAPTLLNGSRSFREAGAPRRATRMIRLNDHMRYARLEDWDAEVRTYGTQLKATVLSYKYQYIEVPVVSALHDLLDSFQ